MTRRRPVGAALACCLALAGCVGVPLDPGRESVARRLGAPLAPAGKQAYLPEGTALDRLTEDEAVLVALWNNALFQETLASLGLAHADLVQAGLLPNPEVGYFFHVPEKPFKYLVDFPLESLWMRPARVRAAAAFSEQEAARLAQAGFDLIRDTRQACADLRLAYGRLEVAREAVRLRGEIARLAKARLDAGDATPQEAATARIDALQADQDAVRLAYDVKLSEERLRLLLGIGSDRSALRLADDALPPAPPEEAGPLVDVALASRPDLEAAGHAVDSATERVRLAKLGVIRFLGILDATSGRDTGREFGPAFRVTLPIFNQGQGVISRAEADRERLVRAHETVKQQIILDVRAAHFRCKQASDELTLVEGKVLPEAEAAIRRAETAFKEGNAAFLVVLETARQVLDSRLRRHVLHADLRRAVADLERATARRAGAAP